MVGQVSADQKKAAADAVIGFYEALRSAVAPLDRKIEVEYGEHRKRTSVVNDYYSAGDLAAASAAIRAAQTIDDWKAAFSSYRAAGQALDSYLASRLAAKGQKEDADALKATGTMERSFSEMLDEHPNAMKVPAVFYPKDELENVGQPGAPRFAAKGIPLYFYIYREGDDWTLVDLTTALHARTNHSGKGLDDKTPPVGLFTALDSKLRFPLGRISYRLPNGTTWNMATTEPWRLSEWLGYIGIGLGLAALAIATYGASVPATLVYVSAGVGFAAGWADLAEKHEAGVLETTDIVVDTLTIAASMLSAGATKLGSVASKGVLATLAGQKVGAVAQFANRLVVPVSLTAAGVDAASFAIVGGQALQQISEINAGPGKPEDKQLALARILGHLIFSGVMSFISIRSNVSHGVKAMVEGARAGYTPDEMRAMGRHMLGNELYSEVYNAPSEPRAYTVTQDELTAGLNAYPGFKGTAQGWHVRITADVQTLPNVRRFYINVNPDSAVALADHLSAELAAKGIGYQFKTRAKVDSFDRTDSALLYVDKKDYAAAKAIVEGFLAKHPGSVSEGSPHMTKPLGKGVAAADEPDQAGLPLTVRENTKALGEQSVDPAETSRLIAEAEAAAGPGASQDEVLVELAKLCVKNGLPANALLQKPHSFGSSRSHIIAEGILDAPPGASREKVLAAVRKRLKLYGIDPMRPHLKNAGVTDDF